jgi:hypothetical protein
MAPPSAFKRLQALGDGVLYGLGLLRRDHFEARGVDQKYFVGTSASTAYDAASTLRMGSGANHARRPH